jgi:Tfp pilus assembly protein FimT
MPSQKKFAGFTLVEIVLVITFMALILTITLGNFFGTKSKYAIITTAEEIAFDLRLAYENAKSQKDGTAWGTRLNNDASGQFFEIFSGDDYASGVKSSRTVLPAEVKFIAPAAGSNLDVVFAKFTGLPAASASITIGLKNFATITKTITVNANGTVTY